MQTKAGIKKEIIYFAKTFRMYGVLIAMIALAMLSPLMLKASELILDNLPDEESIMQSDVGEEILAYMKMIH